MKRKFDWESAFDKILDGIDRDQSDDDEGWWETTVGAKFGAKKKAELKEFIILLLANELNRNK